MPVFTHRMEALPDDDQSFPWTKDIYHLTYAAPIEIVVLLALASRVTSTPLIGWSYAWEDTSEEVDGVWQVGHKHTHILYWFSKRLNLHGCRKFDVLTFDNDGNPLRHHPNILGMTRGHAEHLITKYHAGMKWSMEMNKTVYKPPIKYDYKLPPGFSFARAIIEEVITAPSLVDACVMAEVRPKTVNDIKQLRDEASKACKRFRPIFPKESFRPVMPPDWTVVWAWGPSGVGKTKAMVIQVNNPCVIKPFDSIGCLESLMKQYDENVHDGLVLDEADLSFMTRQQVIAFLDQDEPCTLDVRYKSFTLPANLKKIFISNPDPNNLLPNDPYGAIARRMQVIHITEPTWLPRPVRAERAPLGPIWLMPNAPAQAPGAFGTQ
jgi:hypothetical protein